MPNLAIQQAAEQGRRWTSLEQVKDALENREEDFVHGTDPGTLSDSSKPRNRGLGQTDKTVWSGCRKVTQRRARDDEINKSDVRKISLKLKILRGRGGKKFGAEPYNRALSRADAGASSVLNADMCLVYDLCPVHDPCPASLVFALPPKEPADVPSTISRGQLNPSNGDGWHISISILYVQTDRASPPSCQNTVALSTVQQGARGKERGKI